MGRNWIGDSKMLHTDYKWDCGSCSKICLRVSVDIWKPLECNNSCVFFFSVELFKNFKIIRNLDLARAV